MSDFCGLNTTNFCNRVPGLSFRRNGVSLYASTPYVSSNANAVVVDEQPTSHVELDYETGLLKTSSFNYTRPAPAPARPIVIAPTNTNGNCSGRPHFYRSFKREKHFLLSNFRPWMYPSLRPSKMCVGRE